MSKLTDNYTALANGLGFRYDMASNTIYGSRGGFEFLIYASDSRYPYLLSITTAAQSYSGQEMSAAEKKELTKSIKKVGSVTQQNHSLTFVQSAITNQNKLLEGTNESLDGILSFLKTKGYKACCGLCGQENETACFRMANAYMHLCPSCEARVRQNNMMATQAQEQKSENVIGGVVGALIGSLLGVVCIVLLSELGYVAAISGVVMAVCTLKGYEMLGGKLTKKGIVISVIIMLVMTYIGDKIDWAIMIYREIGSEMEASVFECYQMVPDLVALEVIDIASYIGNLLLLYVFLLVGAIPQIISIVNSKKVQYELVRIGHGFDSDTQAM